MRLYDLDDLAKIDKDMLEITDRVVLSGAYEIELKHKGLNKYRSIRGRDEYLVFQKALAQASSWNEMWQNKANKQSKLDNATKQTKQALDAISEIENILNYALRIPHKINFEWLKDKSDFPESQPSPPNLIPIEKSPMKNDMKYQPNFGFLDKIMSSRKQKKIDEAKIIFKEDCSKWEKEKEQILKKNTEIEEQYKKEIEQWEIRKKDFLNKQNRHNDNIDKMQENYLNGINDTIINCCELVLSKSKYPDAFPQDFDIDYNSETKILIVEYSLPSIDDMPKIKEVKYIQSKDELSDVLLPESTINKLYDSLIYQIALRTIYELYDSDAINAIDSIVFNGWVRAIDKSTGLETNGCIISIQTVKDEFLAINLASVDPKACFKHLKGIGSSKLHSLTPIAPILSIDREDKRFVQSYEVAKDLDESSNLAAMDWEDFEHLIRELFEKEFSESGGEVKITQASRDQGVDAIAFDPDPIRGGKIVIQAKRYTNVVGVSAVRDLYGTVMNEGATKGILVTTSDYGPDAYDFAKDKPLTLLNGANLLHLLGKHGHKATIDIKSAKKILLEKEKST